MSATEKLHCSVFVRRERQEWAASDFPPFRTPVIYSLSSSHSGPSVLRASYAFARGTPLDPGRLRRPRETSNSPKPSRGFQPEKGRFRPPLSSPLAGSSFATPPAPPGSLSVWDQRGDFPLWTLQGKDHSPSVPAPFQASPTVNLNLLALTNADGPKLTFSTMVTH